LVNEKSPPTPPPPANGEPPLLPPPLHFVRASASLDALTSLHVDFEAATLGLRCASGSSVSEFRLKANSINLGPKAYTLNLENLKVNLYPINLKLVNLRLQTQTSILHTIPTHYIIHPKHLTPFVEPRILNSEPQHP
jgi:hypothetical protein